MKEGGSSCWFTRSFMRQSVENLNTSCMINKRNRALVFAMLVLAITTAQIRSRFKSCL